MNNANILYMKIKIKQFSNNWTRFIKLMTKYGDTSCQKSTVKVKNPFDSYPQRWDFNAYDLYVGCKIEMSLR